RTPRRDAAVWRTATRLGDPSVVCCIAGHYRADRGISSGTQSFAPRPNACAARGLTILLRLAVTPASSSQLSCSRVIRDLEPSTFSFRLADYTSVRFVLANSLFLIAHFHNVIIGGRAVRRDGGLQLLDPQDVRLQAHERWGARHRFSLTGAGSSSGA